MHCTHGKDNTTKQIINPKENKNPQKFKKNVADQQLTGRPANTKQEKPQIIQRPVSTVRTVLNTTTATVTPSLSRRDKVQNTISSPSATTQPRWSMKHAQREMVNHAARKTQEDTHLCPRGCEVSRLSLIHI